MKHAFMVIAHNNPEILQAQLKILNSPDADFYFHFDPHFKVNKKLLENTASKSKIYYIKSKPVRWGHFSQIDCEIRLMKAATEHGGYDYYHLLSGVDMPIKTFAEIDSFFKEHAGQEFIHFESPNVTDDVKERISLYHLYPGRKHWQRKINGFFIKIQRILQVNRLKNTGWQVQKGANWFSITDNLAKAIVRDEKIIRSRFRYSFCGDEIFLQTYVINSLFKDKLYLPTMNDDYHMCMRMIDWERGNPYVFQLPDVNSLIKSEYMFARKFDYQSASDAVDGLVNLLKENNFT